MRNRRADQPICKPVQTDRHVELRIELSERKNRKSKVARGKFDRV